MQENHDVSIEDQERDRLEARLYEEMQTTQKRRDKLKEYTGLEDKFIIQLMSVSRRQRRAWLRKATRVATRDKDLFHIKDGETVAIKVKGK